MLFLPVFYRTEVPPPFCGCGSPFFKICTVVNCAVEILNIVHYLEHNEFSVSLVIFLQAYLLLVLYKSQFCNMSSTSSVFGKRIASIAKCQGSHFHSCSSPALHSGSIHFHSDVSINVASYCCQHFIRSPTVLISYFCTSQLYFYELSSLSLQ